MLLFSCITSLIFSSLEWNVALKHSYFCLAKLLTCTFPPNVGRVVAAGTSTSTGLGESYKTLWPQDCPGPHRHPHRRPEWGHGGGELWNRLCGQEWKIYITCLRGGQRFLCPQWNASDTDTGNSEGKEMQGRSCISVIFVCVGMYVCLCLLLNRWSRSVPLGD